MNKEKDRSLFVVVLDESVGFLQYYARQPTNMNLADIKIVSPQGISLNGCGPAIFTEQSSCFSVQVPMGFLKNWKERSNKDVAQVWLLRKDGTLVPQIAEPFVYSLGTFGDYATDYQFYTFPKVVADELASVVVNCNGRLYCHELKKMANSQIGL